MIKTLKNRRKSQKGQALIVVLIIVVVGGLLASATLGYAGTVLKEKIAETVLVNRLYAAEAGIYDVLLSLKNGTTPNSTIPDLNNAHVTMQNTGNGNYILYAGQWTTGPHNDYLNVASTLTYLSGNTYEYKITITKTLEFENKKIEEIGAQIPPGFQYAGSPSGLDTQPPSDTMFNNVHILTWNLINDLGNPGYQWNNKDPVGSTRTQPFRITGSGSFKYYYAWILGGSQDIACVSEMSGSVWTITSKATTSDNKSTTITAKAMRDIPANGNARVLIISWNVSP